MNTTLIEIQIMLNWIDYFIYQYKNYKFTKYISNNYIAVMCIYWWKFVSYAIWAKIDAIRTPAIHPANWLHRACRLGSSKILEKKWLMTDFVSSIFSTSWSLIFCWMSELLSMSTCLLYTTTRRHMRIMQDFMLMMWR